MKKKRNRAAHRSNTQQDELQRLREAFTKGCSKKPAKCVKTYVNTHKATSVDPIDIDGFALSVLEMTMPEWVPAKLQEEMKEALRGFSEWAALWIAESLTDACRGSALATIGIPHIDNMLWTMYAKILNTARKHGVNIANHS